MVPRLQGNHFYSQFHQYAPTVWPLLFGTAATEVEKSVCVELVCAIKSEIFTDMANKVIECQMLEARALKPELQPTPAGRSKLRYLAGRCIAKSKNAANRLIKQNMYTNWPIVQENMTRIHILESTDVSQGDILLLSTDKESLTEIQRKRNVSCALINVSDVAFQFFKILESQRRQSDTLENVPLIGAAILQHQTDILLSETDLKQGWIQIYHTQI